jgi:hypothetical protein
VVRGERKVLSGLFLRERLETRKSERREERCVEQYRECTIKRMKEMIGFVDNK